jgi:hypothetical protein
MNNEMPRPGKRLWRTLFRKPRTLHPFALPISFQDITQALPSLEEASQWGEVMILEDHVSALHRDGTITYGVHNITLLHGDWNLAQWDEVRWFYQPKNWRVTVHRAQLYLDDGNIQPAGVHDQMVDASQGVRLRQLTFGPLRRGVILEFDYQEDHFVPGPMGPCQWGQFFLQTGPPCRRRRFTIAVSQPFAATLRLHNGAQAPVESTVDDYAVYQWELQNVPGIHWDAWTPNPRDFAPWVDFTTLPSWEPVAAHLRREMAPSSSYEIRRLARDLTGPARDEKDKVAALYSYTAREVRYGRPPQEWLLPASRPMGKIFEDLRGDCKDKSALLASLLRAVDIPADIAVVVTRNQGLAPFLPSQRFNHALVVTQVQGQTLWLDTAAGPFTFGELPYQDQGIRGLVLADDDMTYVEVPSPQPKDHGVSWLCRGELSAGGDYRFQACFTARGERAALLRQGLLDRDQDFRQRWIWQTVSQGLPGAQISDIRLGRIEDLTGPLDYQYCVHLEAWSRQIDKLWLFRVPWAEPTIYEGPVAGTERLQPLAPPLVQTVQERHEIQLPPSLTGYGLPYQRREECPWARYETKVHLEGERLICERELSLLGGMVPPESFSQFQRFWAACTRADLEDVVLVKLAEEF